MTRELLQIVSNGKGRFFARCHVCQATSPVCPTPDDLAILAAAKAQGWACVRIGSTGQFRVYCDLPRCQKQA